VGKYSLETLKFFKPGKGNFSLQKIDAASAPPRDGIFDGSGRHLLVRWTASFIGWDGRFF
jgi:hypothetical protein